MTSPRSERLFRVASVAPGLALFWTVATSCASAPSLIVQDFSSTSPDNSHAKSIAYKNSSQSASQKKQPSDRVRPLKNFHGHPGKASRKFQLITSRVEWEAIWPTGYAVPEVDFSKEMILAAFGGEKIGLGHRLSFEGATVSDEVFHVEITEHTPGENCASLSDDMPPKKIRPALILSFPKRGGHTQVNVRQLLETTCLLAPQLDVTCAVVGDRVAKFRNVLPNKALPAIGQKVLCTAHTEDEARTKFDLQSPPNGSKAVAESMGKNSMQFVPDVAGKYTVAVQASRGDGYVARASVEVEAGIQTYEVEITEEEPEGLKGYGLEVWRALEEEESADEPSTKENSANSDGADAESKSVKEVVSEASAQGDSTDVSRDVPDRDDVEVCSQNAPQQWCYAASDGYAHQVIVPAAMGGQLHVVVSKKAQTPPPVAKLKISLAGEALVDATLPDSGKFWATPEGEDGLWRMAVLDLSEAFVTQMGDAIDRDSAIVSEDESEEQTASTEAIHEGKSAP